MEHKVTVILYIYIAIELKWLVTLIVDSNIFTYLRFNTSHHIPTQFSVKQNLAWLMDVN